MTKQKWVAGALLLAALGAALDAAAAGTPAPSVEQIIARNVEARGGLAAWHAVQSMSMSGLMDAGRVRTPAANALRKQVSPFRALHRLRTQMVAGSVTPAAEDGKVVQLPFTLELKRPRKMRLELQFQGKTAVQAYDGAHGWKLRPYLGRNDIEPFTGDETKQAAQQQELDGYLIDHAAKGTTVALEGQEQVEGRDTYRLRLTLKDGQVRHVWLDAHTYLEAMVDGSRQLDGKPHMLRTYLRDYRQDGGLMVPHLLETRVDGVKDEERIIVERVSVNPALADSRFTLTR